MRQSTSDYISKADRALGAARRDVSAEDYEAAASRAYYAMFYGALALLNEESEVRIRKHQGVLSAFGERFAKTGKLDPKYHRWLLSAFDRRIVADYTARAAISDETAAEMLEQAKEFLGVVRDHLGSRGELAKK
jgi:uncharacterized protein (UPF0332 family)